MAENIDDITIIMKKVRLEETMINLKNLQDPPILSVNIRNVQN